jgi:hypothetical protein
MFKSDGVSDGNCFAGTQSLHNCEKEPLIHICFHKTNENRTTIQASNKDTQAYDKGFSVIKTINGLLAGQEENKSADSTFRAPLLYDSVRTPDCSL